MEGRVRTSTMRAGASHGGTTEGASGFNGAAAPDAVASLSHFHHVGVLVPMHRCCAGARWGPAHIEYRGTRTRAEEETADPEAVAAVAVSAAQAEAEVKVTVEWVGRELPSHPAARRRKIWACTSKSARPEATDPRLVWRCLDCGCGQRAAEDRPRAAAGDWWDDEENVVSRNGVVEGSRES